MLTYLYVHPMPFLFYLSLLASHEPVHWTIKCEQWSELAAEVRADDYHYGIQEQNVTEDTQ